MKLPLLISLPHAGLTVPPEAEPYCILTPQEIVEDGDVGAAEIFTLLESEVTAYHTTDIARAIVDQNRAEVDRRPDGVVKTHTCWNVPVYRPFPPEEVVATLLDLYYHPYHNRLRELAKHTGKKGTGTFCRNGPEGAAHKMYPSPFSGVLLGVDCHTMAAKGPPIGPDPGAERPRVCLSNGDGTTCPKSWMEGLERCFQDAFGPNVNVNQPFKGGYITRSHAAELPWVQLELSRAAFMSNAEKGRNVLKALTSWCEEFG